MTCDIYETEMYSWRPGCELSDFKELFEHLASCPACAQSFAQMSKADQAIRQTIGEVPEASALEHRILSGLAHERAQKLKSRSFWRNWTLLPIAAVLLLTLWLGVMPFVREAHLEKQISALLSEPPTPVINSTDQTQLLAWSAAELHGFPGLPPELKRVVFRSASTLEVARHQAVLLNMKNEQRASLLIVNGVLTRDHAPHSFHDAAGSHSRWSDGQKTYVLLFRGDERDMGAYMQRMGIAV